MERHDTADHAEPPAVSMTANTFEGDLVQGTVIQARDIRELHIHAGERNQPPVPRHLPRSLPRLVNRLEELRRLDELAANAAAGPGPFVAILSGMPGVGKSAVGRYWTNRVRRTFVDGDLFGDLSSRGGGGPIPVEEVLGDFLRLLGTADMAIPASLADRADLYRSLTASKRLLVMLDDVEYPAQVSPLIPTGPGSAVVVTSHSDLKELLVSEGATLIHVEQFDKGASRELVAGMTDPTRLDAEPEATADLVEICDGLPLALAICGARLAAHHRWHVADLVQQLTDEGSRLRGLALESGPSVEAIFDLAYDDLDTDHQLVYRRVALHPGPDFTVTMAAVLTGRRPSEVDRLLDDLTDAHLVEAEYGGRFRLHDLVRLHAAQCAIIDDGSETIDAATEELVNWYHRALCDADRAVTPSRLRLGGQPPDPGQPTPAFESPESAFSWFEEERANLVAVVRTAHDQELHVATWQMVEALWPLYFNRKHYAEWIQTNRDAADSAERCHDTGAEARIRIQLARAHIELREFEAAHRELRLAEIKADLSGHRQLQASVREFVGICYLHEEDFDNALTALNESRDMCAAINAHRGVALQDYHIGWALVLSGQAPLAFEPLKRAIDALRDLGDEITSSRALLRLSEAARATGDFGRAREALSESLAITSTLGLRLEEAQAHEGLAAIAAATGRPEDARTNVLRAYAIYRDIGHPRALDLVSGSGVGEPS